MGYRSRVAIRTTPEGLALIQLAHDAASPTKLVDSCSELYVRGDVATVGWREVKWDSNFPEVAAIEKLLQDDGLNGQPWSFVRVGEEQGDYEELYCDDMHKGDLGLERYKLYAEQHIEDANGISVVPDFGIGEMAMLVLSFYENAMEHDAPFVERMLTGSELLREMVEELEKQRKEN